MDKNKFRFWHKRKKEFIDTYNIQFKKSGDISNQYGAIEISQFSGLKDSRNREIYEGDIILDYRKHSDILQFWYCRFANGSFSFFNGMKQMQNIDTTRFEIMGNIFENEEMYEKINFYINF